VASVFNIKQDDLLPVFRVQLLDGTNPVDLTSATAVRLMLSNRAQGLKVDALMTPLAQEGDTLGMVEYEWQEGDTDTIGSFNGEIQVLWPGQLPQTFPAKGYFRVLVNRDLGPATGPGSGAN
jgi:hypothetical protein